MVNFTPKFSENNEKTFDLVTEYMVPKNSLVMFAPDDGIGMVMTVMVKHKISGAPVLDDTGKLVGIISEKDCLRVMVEEAYHNLLPTEPTVEKYMSENVETIDSGMNIIDTANKFLNSSFKRFPVVKGNEMIGQISRSDVLKAALAVKKNTW